MDKFDLVITGGRVIDGTGSPWYYADLGLIGERIAAVVKTRPGEPGHLVGRAREVLDVGGLTVAPGFIDMHSHSDFTILVNPTADSKVMQGVTTEVIGQCGFSAAPLTERATGLVKGVLGAEEAKAEVNWRGFADYAARVEAQGSAVNLAGVIGHSTVRMGVMGFEARQPNETELDQMRDLISQAMRDGAFGFSTGLIYTPGSYSKPPEVVALARAAAEHGGLYFTHMRSEARGLFEAVDEAINVGREAHMPVQISHLKCAGAAQGSAPRLIATIQAARAEGIEVTADQYPYTAGSTGLSALLPPWVHEGDQEAMRRRLLDPAARARMKADMQGRLPGWDNDFGTIPFSDILIAGCADKSLEGRTVQEIAEAWGRDPYETTFDILATIGLSTDIVIFMIREDEAKRLMSQEFTMIGSDASCTAPRFGGKPHPRTYGTFARVLGQWARDDQVFSLAQAVRKMTGFPAGKLGLQDRGLIHEGFAADITVFDPTTVADRATYTEPHQFPSGIVHVIVNGRFAVRDGRPTGALPGKFLRRR